MLKTKPYSMSQQLINHSPDLKRLRDEGYEIEVRNGYLMAYHIPYLNGAGEIGYGTLVTDLTLASTELTARPSYHVIHFVGENPCDKGGGVIQSIQHNVQSTTLFEGLTVNFSFSNKPVNGYADYHEKISRYADIISAPAKSLDNTVTERTFRVVPDRDGSGPFRYADTNSSRANILPLNARFEKRKIAIVGMGGTGAYILDLVAKTPVAEIHLYDGDDFQLHNAFRSPGASSAEDLNRGMSKVDHYREIYARMHTGIVAHHCYVGKENLDELNEMSHVFICIDRNSARGEVVAHLTSRGVVFLDVGMGVNVVDESLIGTLRVTTGTPVKNDHLALRLPVTDIPDNDYTTNIQIADLNMLNAVMAVIKWKKLVGFYQDLELEHHCSYSINVAQLLNEDAAA